MTTQTKALLLAAGVTLACAAPAAADTVFPSAGYQFNCDIRDGKTFVIDGWNCTGGGYYPKAATLRENRRGSVDETMECCLTSFTRGPIERPTTMLLVRTKPITRSARGGVEVEEVVDWVELKPGRGEEFASECTIGKKTYSWGLLDRRKRTLLGLSVTDEGFSQEKHVWRKFPCETGDGPD